MMNQLKSFTLNQHQRVDSFRPRNKGFTLVEMLISLVLCGIIFLSAYQVISNLIQYQVRYNDKSEDQQDELILRNMIGQILAKGLHQYNLYYRIRKEAFFKGEGESIQLISRAYSDHYDLPGYRIYSLYKKNGEFFVSYKRYDKESVDENMINISSGVKINKIAFSYYQEGMWVEQWNDDKKIPKFVKVKIDLKDDVFFEWINQTGKA